MTPIRTEGTPQQRLLEASDTGRGHCRLLEGKIVYRAYAGEVSKALVTPARSIKEEIIRELPGKLVSDTLMGWTLSVNRGVITASVRRYRLGLE